MRVIVDEYDVRQDLRMDKRGKCNSYYNPIIISYASPRNISMPE